jgi:hypothetical protein
VIDAMHHDHLSRVRDSIASGRAIALPATTDKVAVRGMTHQQLPPEDALHKVK